MSWRRIVFMATLLILMSSSVLWITPTVSAQSPEGVVLGHTVERGDTLSGIARRYGTTVAALISYNDLPSTTIHIGQRIYIPPGSQPSYVIEYVVQAGDTLSGIARRYGTTVSLLVTYNRLPTTNIRIGQALLIPSADSGTLYPLVHIVQRGDTLFRLAQRYGTTINALTSVNNLNSTRIFVGQRLIIPLSVEPATPFLIHIVQRGDTLSRLARRYGVTIATIQNANGLTSDRIFVGQRLQIPNR